MQKDPYKVLGISHNATAEEIKKAYRNLVKKYHPDKYKGHPLEELAKEKMQEINDAYQEVTSNKNKVNQPNDSGQWQDWQKNWHEQTRNQNSSNGYGQQRPGQSPYYQGTGCCNGSICQTLGCLCCADSCCECMGGDLCGCC